MKTQLQYTSDGKLICIGRTFPALVKLNNKTYAAMSNKIMELPKDIESLEQIHWAPDYETFRATCYPIEFEMYCRFKDAIKKSQTFANAFELHCKQRYLQKHNINAGFDTSLALMTQEKLLNLLGLLGATSNSYQIVGSKGDTYQVNFDATTMQISCNCKAFQFRKTCKHCQQVLDRFASQS